MRCKCQASNRHESKKVAEIRVQESIIQGFLFVQSKTTVVIGLVCIQGELL